MVDLRTLRTLCELTFTLVNQCPLREVKAVRDVVLTRLVGHGLRTPRRVAFAAALACLEGLEALPVNCQRWRLEGRRGGALLVAYGFVAPDQWRRKYVVPLLALGGMAVVSCRVGRVVECQKLRREFQSFCGRNSLSEPTPD